MVNRLMRKPTILGSIGDPMSELNIQRRLQWLRESDPNTITYFDEETVKADPALQRAVQELHWLRVRAVVR